ncbi:MAG TPA: TonB-dependent receptor, partial [Chitinophagaceae bacterium]|nr:TonB-dependent receptor [Chitinophagaceae bacterium]
MFLHRPNIFQWASPTTELQSYFGRAILNYKDKYLFTGTIRADGSTKFGENNKYGYFPSLAVAWKASNEDFFRDIAFVNNLKVRLSWGKTGNQEFPSGAALDRFTIEKFNGSDWGVRRLNWANPDLKWETSETINGGIDFTILNNRIWGSVDHFRKTTQDVLYEQTLAQPAPTGKIWVNLDGEVINKGWEIVLNANLVNQSELNWNVGTVVSFLDNEVTGLKGFYETAELRGQGFSNTRGQRLIANQPLNVWYLFEWDGLDRATGKDILLGKIY